MYKKKFSQSYYTNRHSCFLLTYHLVLVTKFKYPVLACGVKESVHETITTIFREKGLRLINIDGGADSLHILFEAGPEIRLLDLVNIIKTKTARFARRDHIAFLQKYYPNRDFWANSYFITTVDNGTNDAIQEYINIQ